MKSYGQYCPVAQAAEILNQRWTILVLRDVLYGARRFNEIRRFVPLMSPTLLSKRLKELAKAGLLRRAPTRSKGAVEYCPTPACEELRPIIELLGAWGQRWVRNRLKRDDLDVSLLMASIHALLDVDAFPRKRTVVSVRFRDGPKLRKEAWRLDRWWLVIDSGASELCLKDPGYDVDVFVDTDLAALTGYFMGDFTAAEATRSGKIELHGAKALVGRFGRWMPRSHFGEIPMPPEPLDILRVISRSPSMASPDARQPA